MEDELIVDDGGACVREFLANTEQLMTQLSGAPWDQAQDSEAAVFMQHILQDQRFKCLQAGFQYFRMTVLYGDFFARTAPGRSLQDAWNSLTPQIQHERERFGMCVPRSCSTKHAKVTLFPFFFQLMAHADLGVPVLELKDLQTPQEWEVDAQEQVYGNRHFQAMFDRYYATFQAAQKDTVSKNSRHIWICGCAGETLTITLTSCTPFRA